MGKGVQGLIRRDGKRLTAGRCTARLLPALLLCTMLSGCSLARADLQEAAGTGERLCGVLVTVGDQEAGLWQEEELEGREFHSLSELEEALTAEVCVEGVRLEDGTYAFEGVRGHFLGIFEEEDKEGSYTRFANDGSFADVKAATNVSDAGTKQEMKAKVLAPPGIREPIYINPVYQRADGTVYVSLSGGGFLVGGVYEEDGSVTGGVREEGEVYSTTYTSEERRRVDGKEELDSLELSVSCEVAYPVEAARLLELDEENHLIGIREISREMSEAPLRKEAAYVIVEEERADGSKKRSLYNCGQKEGEEPRHTLCYLGEDGLLVPMELSLVSPEAKESPGND